MEMIANKADWVAVPIPGTARAWTDYDLNNASCPADTIGAIFMFVREESGFGTASLRCGVRPNGSTDDGNWMWFAHSDSGMAHECHYPYISGCDANKLVETYQSSSSDMGNTRLYVIGFIQTGDAHLLTNCVEATWVTGPTTGSWDECHFDSAVQGGDTPQAWVMKISNNYWNNDDFQPRPKGSSYSYRTQCRYESHHDRIAGVGTSNRMEVFVGDNTNFKVSVRGYILQNYTSRFDNPVDYATPSDDSWYTKSLPDVPEDAIAIFENDSGASSSTVGVRTDGDTSTRHANIGPGPVVYMVSVGPNQQVGVSKRYSSTACPITGWIEVVSEHTLTTDDLHGNHQVEGKGVVQPAAIAPTYQDMTFYFDEPIDPPIFLGQDWVNANPDDYSGQNFPFGLEVSAQGYLSGTPVCPPLELSPASLSNSGTVQQKAVDTEHHVDAGDTRGNCLIQDGEIIYTPPQNYELFFNGDTVIELPITLNPNTEYSFEAEMYADAAGSGRVVLGCGEFYMLARPDPVLGINNWGKLTNGAATAHQTWGWVRCRLPSSGSAYSWSEWDNASHSHSRGSTSSNSVALCIGSSGPDGGGINRMLGRIRNVKMWTGNFGTLIHEWPINDNSNTIKDIVGSADGTLTIGSGSWQQI